MVAKLVENIENYLYSWDLIQEYINKNKVKMVMYKFRYDKWSIQTIVLDFGVFKTAIERNPLEKIKGQNLCY